MAGARPNVGKRYSESSVRYSVARRERCPDCGAVLRRIYYQTGSGRRYFRPCGWGCFDCAKKSDREPAPDALQDAIARRRDAIASAEPEPDPDELQPEPDEESGGLLRSLARGIARAADRSAERTAEKVEQSDRRDRASAAGVPPELLASLDATADELVDEQRGRRKK